MSRKGHKLYKVVNGRVKCTACLEWAPHATITISSGRAVCATCAAERAERLPENQKLKGAAHQPYIPSIKEIWEEKTRQIRATWSESVLIKRGGGDSEPYEVPVVARSAFEAAKDCRARIGGKRGI
jgi:hypothetical protein